MRIRYADDSHFVLVDRSVEPEQNRVCEPTRVMVRMGQIGAHRGSGTGGPGTEDGYRGNRVLRVGTEGTGYWGWVPGTKGARY